MTDRFITIKCILAVIIAIILAFAITSVCIMLYTHAQCINIQTIELP